MAVHCNHSGVLKMLIPGPTPRVVWDVDRIFLKSHLILTGRHYIPHHLLTSQTVELNGSALLLSFYFKVSLITFFSVQYCSNLRERSRLFSQRN